MITAIVNPAAGSGAARRRWPAAERLLTERLGPVQVYFTKAPGHATVLARELAGSELTIVAGGDGTLNEVVNGGAARIAVLPLASGGDFARMLGLGSVAAAVERIGGGRSRPVDLFRARFQGTSRLFLNAASFGLGATAAERARSLPGWLRGRARYLTAAVPTLSAGRAFRVSVWVDDQAVGTFDITTAAVCNGQYQGGGIRIAPQAVLDDGMVDVTVVELVSLAEVTRRLPILYNGAIYSHPQVRHWRGRRVRVEGDAPLELDGEVVGALPVEIEAAGTVEIVGG